MKALKYWGLFVLLLLISNIMNHSFGENIEIQKKLIITDDNTILFDHKTKQKIIKLSFGDHVLLKHDSVVLYNNLEGIVDLDKTNYIPKEWFECDKLTDVIFYLPSFFENKIKKREYLSGKRKSIECKAVGDKSIIIARLYLHSIDEILNDIKLEQKLVGVKIDFKKITIDDSVIYYYQGFDEESEPFHEVVLPVSKNKTYVMVVYNGRTRDSIARKMLFSIKLKKN